MEGRLQRRAGIAALAGDLIVAALQIGAGAERAAGAGDNEAAHIVAAIRDLVERFGEAAEHIDRHRIHHFLMIELQDGDLAVEIERDVFELHGFLAMDPRLIPRCGTHVCA